MMEFRDGVVRMRAANRRMLQVRYVIRTLMVGTSGMGERRKWAAIPVTAATAGEVR